MSQENVESVKRWTDAYNRRDVEAMLAELDPEVEWHSAILAPLEGEATLYCGHEGFRQLLRDVYEALDEVHAEVAEIRDLGDRTVAIGRMRVRGRESGAETESATGVVTDFKNGKAIRVRAYLDPKDALEAAGLRE
jgi:ketosteroid isomerase-like protein